MVWFELVAPHAVLSNRVSATRPGLKPTEKNLVMDLLAEARFDVYYVLSAAG